MEAPACSDGECLPVGLGISSKELRAEALFQVGWLYWLPLVSDDAYVVGCFKLCQT